MDKVSPPYQNTRRLITAGDVKNDDRRAHSSVVPGSASVKTADGKLAHEAVWHYLFNQPVDLTGPATSPDVDCEKDLRAARFKKK